MKTYQRVVALLVAHATIAQGISSALAAGTMNPVHHHAWDANCGWMDFRPERPDAGDGFTFGEFSCGGFLWSPNLGWINCGDGSPANRINYDNSDSADFGVNHYGTGDLYGLAWSANAGWINFGWWTLEPTNVARPRVNLTTGEFSGYVWSANCGWINLGAARMTTDRMDITDTDGDGISDAFEIAYSEGLTRMTASSDTDGDGQSDQTEYIALTDPLKDSSLLRVTRITKLPDVNSVELEWTSTPARIYDIEALQNFADTTWLQLGTVPGASDESSTVQAVEAGPPQAFLRVTARLPLQP